MSKNRFPNLVPCNITVKGTKHVLELLGEVCADEASISFELKINGDQHDKVEFVVSEKPMVGILEDNNFILYGTLYGAMDDDVPVRVEARNGEFSRPIYTFYVGDQKVHEEKGLPRRF